MDSRSAPRVLLVAESLRPIASGIGRVARLTTRVLAEYAARGAITLRALSLSDAPGGCDLPVAVRACSGSRARFVLECQRAALDCTHFIYDFAGMARAHPTWIWPRRRALVWVHGIEVWEDARRDRLRSLARADVLVANTAYTQRRAAALHGEDLARAIPCWLATDADEQPPLSSTNSEPELLILGRIDPAGGQKGHRELVDAWPDVVHAVPNARLRIAGGGPGQAQIARCIAESPARERIELIDFVPEPQVAALWARAAVFAMPSRCEGLGIAYLEAMRHGVPVIGSVHDAAPEINLHGVTGYNVDLDSPGELAGRVIELLRDRPLARRLGEAGRARWRAHFRFSSFRQRFQPIVERFLSL